MPYDAAGAMNSIRGNGTAYDTAGAGALYSTTGTIIS